MAFVTKTLSNGEKLMIPISIEEMNSLLKDQEEEKNKIYTMYLSLENSKMYINEDIKRLFQIQENIDSIDIEYIDEYYMWQNLNEINYKIISNKIKKKFDKKQQETEEKQKQEEISDQLATFLGVELGTLKKPTDIIYEIEDYINDSFYYEDDHPNENDKINKLLAILKLKSNEEIKELTYLNLKQYINHHFRNN